MKIRKLNEAEIREVYHTYMTKDFPIEEVKPLKKIFDLLDQGAYECLGLYEDEALLAYAYLVMDQESRYLLLDYLAVCSGIRGKGYGSRMLRELRNWYKAWNGFYIESEALRTSADETQLQVRRRRLDFYSGNGCVLTCVKAEVFGTEYSIFYMPIQETDPDHEKELNHVYHRMFSLETYRKYIRVWRRSISFDRVYRWNSEEDGFQEKKSLMDALGYDPKTFPRVITFTGAGGKTSSMFQLADELAEQGKRVLVSTTTHFHSLRPEITASVSSEAEIREELWQERKILAAGKPVIQETFQGITKLAMPDELDRVNAIERILSFCDVILLEADGAKQKPVKVPNEREPVYPERTEAVIACLGLTGIGDTFAESCFRFDTAGGWLGRRGNDSITPEDAACILQDEKGGRKGLRKLQEERKDCSYRILLNQADTVLEKEEAVQLVKFLPKELREICIMEHFWNSFHIVEKD